MKTYSYHATWENLKLYPRFWNAKTTNPNFRLKGFTIRFGWWYFAFIKKN